MAPCSASSSRSPGPCSAIHVLVVDDEETFRVNLADMLRDDGHPVTDVASAEAAVTAGLSDLSILVTDYSMPGETGVALADRLNGTAPATPVVLVTAHRTAAIEKLARARSFMTLLAKPVAYDELHALIHRLVP